MRLLENGSHSSPRLLSATSPKTHMCPSMLERNFTVSNFAPACVQPEHREIRSSLPCACRLSSVALPAHLSCASIERSLLIDLTLIMMIVRSLCGRKCLTHQPVPSWQSRPALQRAGRHTQMCLPGRCVTWSVSCRPWFGRLQRPRWPFVTMQGGAHKSSLSACQPQSNASCANIGLHACAVTPVWCVQSQSRNGHQIADHRITAH